MTVHTKVYTVGNIVEARKKIEELERQGYLEENIYVLTHDKERTAQVTEQTDGHKIGVAEEGIITATTNLFRSTGDELRAKLRAMGVSKERAEQLEAEMDQGRIVILASNGSGIPYEGDQFDENIT
ncbi:MAG TPA: general stress protein, partial [Bacilli bacterium]